VGWRSSLRRGASGSGGMRWRSSVRSRTAGRARTVMSPGTRRRDVLVFRPYTKPSPGGARPPGAGDPTGICEGRS
jgi:hypothetical protein